MPTGPPNRCWRAAETRNGGRDGPDAVARLRRGPAAWVRSIASFLKRRPSRVPHAFASANPRATLPRMRLRVSRTASRPNRTWIQMFKTVSESLRTVLRVCTAVPAASRKQRRRLLAVPMLVVLLLRVAEHTEVGFFFGEGDINGSFVRTLHCGGSNRCAVGLRLLQRMRFYAGGDRCRPAWRRGDGHFRRRRYAWTRFGGPRCRLWTVPGRIHLHRGEVHLCSRLHRQGVRK
jgi:hypothetical protein